MERTAGQVKDLLYISMHSVYQVACKIISLSVFFFSGL
jgi:hypothetical protein